MNKLSVIITSLNDPELQNTINSIRETAGDKVKIAVCDDCSSTPIQVTGADKVLHNKFRCGVGPSRHVGVMAADTEYVLICDAHMTFSPGWYEATLPYLRPKVLGCAVCLGLDSKHRDIAHPVAEYHGATLRVCGPDPNTGKTQIMEAVWGPKQTQDDPEIPAVMGAAYICQRDWFLQLGALRYLRHWGADEVLLSVKAWLSGGEVRLFKNVRIGHKFTLPRERQPFDVRPGYPAYNKLLAIHTLLPPDLATTLQNSLRASMDPREWHVAFDLMKADWHLFAQEQALNQALFTRPFPWLVERFGLK